MKNKTSAIGLIVSLILIVVLSHPGWLPLPQQMSGTMQELIRGHFLLKGNLRLTAAHLLTLLLALLVIYFFCTVVSFILEIIGRKRGRSSTITSLLQSIVRYFSVIIGIFWGLSILGVNTTAVLASVGVIGLIIGFGAQSLIEDIITGIFIIFEGEYSVGDIIILDDFRGVVRSIGVRTTVIEDAGGNLKIVNNSDIRNLQNRSRNNSLAVCDIGVSYDTDITGLRAMLDRELPRLREKHPDLYLSAPVLMGIEELADSAVVLRFHVAAQETDIYVARRTLNEDLFCLFREKQIEIPFPQVVVHEQKD